MEKHAFLSASASERWLRCPPSAKLCAGAPDQESESARQGSDAHALCEYLLLKALGRPASDPTENLTWYNAEMREAAEDYVAFVMSQLAEAEKRCPHPLVLVEQKVAFPAWVPGGFGTADALILADDMLYVTDFKYGVGCLVTAAGEDGTGNTQLKCYALGAIDTFRDTHDFRRIRLSVFQPRRDNVDSFDLSKADLLEWAENVLAPAARLALEGLGEFTAGNHCQFCKVKATCRKRAEYAMELAKYDYAEAPTLDEKEIAEILPRVDLLVRWAEDIRSYALARALAGVQFPGYRLVEGRSARKYADEAAVAKVVSDAGVDPYDRKLAGITEMTARLGKKRFEELLKGLLVRPTGKPVLVPVRDAQTERKNQKHDFTEEKE